MLARQEPQTGSKGRFKAGSAAVDERNTPCPELEIASGASEPVVNSIKPEAAFSLY